MWHLMLHSNTNHRPLGQFLIVSNCFGLSVVLRNLKDPVTQNQAHNKLGRDAEACESYLDAQFLLISYK